MALLALAGPLKAAGYEPVLIYEGIEDDLESRIAEACEGVICLGVSAMTGNQLKGAIEYSKLVKELYPELPVVWGGYHPTLLPEQTLAEDYVDIVVRGQGEVTFVELLKRLEAGGGPGGVAGVSYKDGGRQVANPSRSPKPLESLPPYPYELLDVEKIINRNSAGFRSLQYLSSSGCPFSCSFCAEPLVNERKWLSRSSGQVVEEVVDLARIYRLDHVTFIDPNFFVSRQRAREIFRGMVDAGLGIEWSAVARVDQVLKFDEELWRLIRESGCRSLGVGAESGSQEMLSLIDKRISVDEIFESATMMKEHGVGGIFSFMIGYPVEEEVRRRDMLNTVAAIKKVKSLNAEIKTPVFYYAPYPGSPLYPVALKNGFRGPRTLKDWADFGFTTVMTPWVSGREKDYVERCSTFYFPIAFPDSRVLKWTASGAPRLPFALARRLASLRVSRDAYGWPLEWQVAKLAARVLGRGVPLHVPQLYS